MNVPAAPSPPLLSPPLTSSRVSHLRPPWLPPPARSRPPSVSRGRGRGRAVGVGGSRIWSADELGTGGMIKISAGGGGASESISQLFLHVDISRPASSKVTAVPVWAVRRRRGDPFRLPPVEDCRIWGGGGGGGGGGEGCWRVPRAHLSSLMQSRFIVIFLFEKLIQGCTSMICCKARVRGYSFPVDSTSGEGFCAVFLLEIMMDSNREEAFRAREIAVKKMKNKDFIGNKCSGRIKPG